MRIWAYIFLPFSFLLILSLLLCNFTGLAASFPHPSRNNSECDALFQFSNSLTISAFASENCYIISPNMSYPKTASWKNGTDCCTWDGVTCHTTNHVIGLDLSCSWLQGPLHSNSTLFSLSRLRRLNLAGNDFSASRIPPRFGVFTEMEHLNLSHSGFSGPVPVGMISRLSSLVTLDLSDFYYGSYGLVAIEDDSFKWLVRNLTQLRELVLDGMNMSRISPTSLSNLSSALTSLSLPYCKLRGIFPINIFGLPNLRSLSLSSNYDLMGSFPQTNLTSLFVLLDLSYTKFHGSIAASLGNLTSMSYLDLSNNEFTGVIPPAFENLKHLTHLDLSNNNLSGTVNFEIFATSNNLQYISFGGNNLTVLLQSNGDCSFPRLKVLELSGCNLTKFPYFLSSASELSLLDISRNTISGRIPDWFWGVGRDTLQMLNLSFNKFSGEIPSSIRHTSSLEQLSLSSNNFTGPLPVPPASTIYFVAASNTFSGDIPYEICSASWLQLLDLSNNHLTGFIPHCFINFNASLSVLDLGSNRFVGHIPDIFLQWNNLRTISLSQNRLRGQLPRSLAHCENLEVLDLSENELEDRFPYWLGALPNLQVLALRSNKFHGPVDNISGRNTRPFPKLRIFDLSGNNFSGPLPANYVLNLRAMRNQEKRGLKYMSVGYYGATSQYYQDSIAVHMKGLEMELVKILTVFTTVDFSSNLFEGEIPEVIGELKALKGLNFSHNNLTGKIPSSMGNLTNLEWLDLSSNKLDGEIPRGLADLTMLAYLNLSNNKLTGPIPRSTQFDTFGHSFDGNPGLCGRPLPKACENDARQTVPSTPHGEDEIESDTLIEWKAVPIGYGCGLVFGISAGYIILGIRRSKWLMRLVQKKLPRKSSNSKKNVAQRNHRRGSTRDQWSWGRGNKMAILDN